MSEKVSPTVSPIRWMVTRDKTYGYAPGVEEVSLVILKDGFTKVTAAKAYKDSLNEEGIKIIPYYE